MLYQPLATYDVAIEQTVTTSISCIMHHASDIIANHMVSWKERPALRDEPHGEVG